jgi:hypothetical protein
MMMPCRIFTGYLADSKQYSSTFAPASRQLIYVLDEKALNSQNRHEPAVNQVNDVANAEAFKDYLGYDRLTFLERFVKPCYLIQSVDHQIKFPEPGSAEMALVAERYRVWVNVQEGAQSITSPCIGQLIPVGTAPDKPPF